MVNKAAIHLVGYVAVDDIPQAEAVEVNAVAIRGVVGEIVIERVSTVGIFRDVTVKSTHVIRDFAGAENIIRLE